MHLSYEEPSLLDPYLLFHYGADEDLGPWPLIPRKTLQYPQRCVHQAFDLSGLKPGQRALDVGCAVGRSSFEFAALGLQTTGVDYSKTFIRAAETLRRTHSLTYRVPVQGQIHEMRTATPPAGIPAHRIRFATGDAHDLSPFGGGYDYVLGANLLCRLHHPQRFLDQLPDLVGHGGQLVLTTPCTWQEAWTPADQWIGGTPEHGRTETALPERLKAHFKLEWEDDLPFVIREHERKFQFTFAHAFRWRRLPH